MSLKLYYAPKTCSLAPMIALEEAGAEYEAHKVNFAENEQNTAPYKYVNPKGRVPALATDKGVITENVAILAFIADVYPKMRLSRSDPFAFAQMQAFNAYLSSTVHPHHAHNRRGSRWSDDPAVVEALKIKVPQNMADCAEYIEKYYLKGNSPEAPWVMGGQYTVADAYLFTIANWLEGDGVDTSKFPKILAHRAAMLERPAVVAAMEKHRG